LIRNYILLRLAIVSALLSPATKAFADDISFDYLQATYTSGTVDLNSSHRDIEGNGIGFRLSLSFDPHYAITLEVLATTFDDFQGQQVDTIKISNLGITGHTEIAQATEVFGNASILIAKITAKDGITESTQNDIGYQLKTGLRHRLNNSFEVEAALSHLYVFDQPENTLHTEIRYYVRKLISIGLAYKTGDNKDALSLNGRMNF